MENSKYFVVDILPCVDIIEIEVKAFGRKMTICLTLIWGKSTILIDAGMLDILKRFGRAWKNTEVRLKH